MLEKIVSAINDALYSYVLIILLVLGGIYFTIRSRGVQFKMLPEQFRVVGEKPASDNKKSVSSFQALMVSTASRVGTGNIIGVSTALCLGGFGSVFWMWIIALIGGASAFIESTLAQIYKKEALVKAMVALRTILRLRSNAVLSLLYSLFYLFLHMVSALICLHPIIYNRPSHHIAFTMKA